jgi:hypothetical protein
MQTTMSPAPAESDIMRPGVWRCVAAVLAGLVLVVLGNLISYDVYAVLASPARRADAWYSNHAISAMIRGGLLQLIGWPYLIFGVYQIAQRVRQRVSKPAGDQRGPSLS